MSFTGSPNNPGSGSGAVASPINLVTTAPSVVLSNKLLAGDANPALQILGSGVIGFGAGGANPIDSIIQRGSASAGIRCGTNSNGDIQLSNQVITTVLTDNLLIGTGNGAHTYFTLANTNITMNQTLKNGVAGNETATATAGAGLALPATVQGYLQFIDSGGTTRKIPFYNV